MLTDVLGQCKIVDSIITRGSADVNGASADVRGFQSVLIRASFAAAGDTFAASTLYSDIELEHCDDNSTWVDCSNADLSAYVTSTASNTGTLCEVDANAEAGQAYTARYIGSKRYVRAVLKITGTHTNGTATAVQFMLSASKDVPVV
jgi:hypothetical protein